MLGRIGTGQHTDFLPSRRHFHLAHIAAFGGRYDRRFVPSRGGGNALIAIVRALEAWRIYWHHARWPAGTSHEGRTWRDIRGQTIGRCPAAGNNICSIAVPGLFLMGPVCSSLSVRAGGRKDRGSDPGTPAMPTSENPNVTARRWNAPLSISR